MEAIKPRLLETLTTVNGSWTCSDCKLNTQGRTYVLEGAHRCQPCAKRRLQSEFVNQLSEHMGLPFDATLVAVASAVDAIRMEGSEGSTDPALNARETVELVDAMEQAVGAELSAKERVRVLSLKQLSEQAGATIAEMAEWANGSHVPPPLRGLVEKVVARAEMLAATLAAFNTESGNG